MSYMEPTKEEIEKCLNCTRPDCVDCMSPFYSGLNRGTRHHWTENEMKLLYNKKLNNSFIAKMVGVSQKTVRTKRKEIGFEEV